jgi:NADH:ubiquinone oxidoreductase subunit 5 (subunit L)/multisubunit Na+/H+ antiporter MnhA subunit
VPTETLTTNERAAPEAVPELVPKREDEALRRLALRHLERVRKFKLSLAVYLLSLLVLTPVWIVTQYEQADGWPEHLSTRSRYAGDWDPWIIWVALIGAFVVAIYAIRAYFERGSTEDEIEHEIERLKSTR